MRSKNLGIIVCLVGIFLLVSTCCFAQDDENVGFIKKAWRNLLGRNEEASEPVEEKSVMDLTEDADFEIEEKIIDGEPVSSPEINEKMQIPPKEDIISDIYDDLDTWGEEISMRMPMIIRKVDDKGEIMYLYKKPSGEVVHFEELNEEELLKIFNRVSHEATIMRTEHIQRQIETVRRLDHIRRMNEQAKGVRTAPKTPRTPPEPPKTYTPPRVPREAPKTP